jgi:hypothetical protein
MSLHWADPGRVFVRWLRPVLILLLLVCFAGLQTAAAISVHSHEHGSTGDCCAICHVGHLPALEAGIASDAAPAAIVEWRSWREEPVLPGGQSPVLNFSRAPPA